MNILLITDDTSIISMVKHTLKATASSDRLFTARSGSEGIEIINKSLNSQLDLIPGLIIIDFDSTEVNALYVLQRVTTDLKIQDCQTAVLTSPLELRDQEYLENLDLEYVIEKPLEHKAFQELFNSMKVDYEVDDKSPSGATPYRQPSSPPSLDEEELRRILVLESSPPERKRLNQLLRTGANPLTFIFSNTILDAKRKLRKNSYSVVIAAIDDLSREQLQELFAACRERVSTPVIALVGRGNEDAGKAAVLEGANLYLVRDTDNYLNILSELLSNMTERKRLELVSRAALDADKEMLRDVVERAPMIMLRIDATFCIKDCNDTFSKATKQLRHALVGKPLFDILPDLEVLPLISVLEDAIPYSRESYRMKTIGQSHSATTYWDFHVWSIRRTIASGPEAIFIATDVSERVEAEQQRERFVAALAHDIRNPVQGGQRVLDSVLSGKHGELQPARAKQLIGSLHKSNQNLLLMLSNLIDVYKFETASMSLNFQRLDLVELMREQIAEVSHVAAASEVVFKEVYPEKPPHISGDLNSIRRLLSNLFHNALKYCIPKSEIEVKIWVVSSLVFVRIRNQGNPIAAEKLEQLFRSVCSGVPIRHGSGLGLYLCRRIVEVHDAKLDCTTSADKGTSFSLRFLNVDYRADDDKLLSVVS